MTDKEILKKILELQALREERKRLYIKPLSKEIHSLQTLLIMRKKNKIKK